MPQPLSSFHLAVANWFARHFAAPTPAQSAAWPAVQAGENVLVAAPTGSGKTLTAFLAAIDALLREGLATGALPDEVAVVYVSPLKALSNDIRLNLQAPLAGIRAEARALGLPDIEIRTAVRSGDTPPRERAQVAKKPPHILVTTPESLYVLLSSVSGRAMLATVRTVIVDEIHAVAASKRGSHLALSLERLQDLSRQQPLLRIGLSATQKPVDLVARFLVGPDAPCRIVDIGYAKTRDLALELPPVPLAAVMSNDQWELVHARIVELAVQHRTTLVFVNTRRMAERIARHLADRLGKELVAAHHGSLAKETRLDAEQRLKRGELKVLVATASLELGLDIGDVDLVCQLSSPRAIAAFLQRAGRSGHAVGGVPKARLFPQSRDDLVECAALLDCVRRGELDALRTVPAPLDVLAQQIVAETACRDCDEDALFALVRRAWPYAALPRADFDAVVAMLADVQGTRPPQIHRDAVHRVLRGRRGSRLVALTSGGTIPDTGDYTVLLEPQAQTLGSVNEDFAVESLAGDVFQLGNASYRILKIEPGRVRVEDAHGAAPNIPFWLGEAPGRSDELSAGVSRLRAEVAERLAHGGETAAARWLVDAVGLDGNAARQIVDHLARAAAAFGGVLPTQSRIVIERFFDASGGMQLVIHSPFGSRLNRAWGLALRKRFCRSFNFELQAAATEDAIVLSLSTSHSFPLLDVAHYLHPNTALDVLVQALLDAPLFGVRWRWNATTALALPRFTGGRKVAPQLQRMRSEDLLASVFPDQVACAENLTGPRAVPDHPLVRQTLTDCLEQAMDAPGFLALLRRIVAGDVEVLAFDLAGPSPLAAEALNARPYAFLDDAPLEERRTQAVQMRRYDSADAAGELGQLDPAAIARVRADAWPAPRSADEMHEALHGIGALTDAESIEWTGWLQALALDGRATRLLLPAGGVWVAAEQLAALQRVWPAAPLDPPLTPPPGFDVADRDTALRDLLRSRLSAMGPVTATALAALLQLAQPDIDAALVALQTEGAVLQGRFTPGTETVEWCERHLLARIHRTTLAALRREIEPVEPADFVRFVFDWQRIADRGSGPDALAAVLQQLEGFEAPAAAWESEILAARSDDHSPRWLDDACTSGRVLWTRLRPAAGGSASLRSAPIVLLPRASAAHWALLAPPPADIAALSASARRVAAVLEADGASFFPDLCSAARLLPAQAEDALAELVVAARVHCDSYAGLRALLLPPSKRPKPARGRAPLFGIADAGRWSLLRPPPAADRDALAAAIEHVARTLLARWGVVAWQLLEREAGWLPPWRELVRVYRRLEARGEVRGGRFVAGISGEQYALPDAVAALRGVRRRGSGGGGLVDVVGASDPANLLGSVVAGARVARVPGSMVAWRDGVPLATLAAGRFDCLVPLPAVEQRALQAQLQHGPARRWSDAVAAAPERAPAAPVAARSSAREPTV